MKKLVFAAVFAFAAPMALSVAPASAFQVISPEQMHESGMGLAEGRYFSRQQMEQMPGTQQFQFFSNPRRYYSQRSSSERNFYGNIDGGGRYYGDNGSSNYRGCDYAESAAAKLDAMSGRGYAYPCQRFR